MAAELAAPVEPPEEPRLDAPLKRLVPEERNPPVDDPPPEAAALEVPMVELPVPPAPLKAEETADVAALDAEDEELDEEDDEPPPPPPPPAEMVTTMPPPPRPPPPPDTDIPPPRPPRSCGATSDT